MLSFAAHAWHPLPSVVDHKAGGAGLEGGAGLLLLFLSTSALTPEKTQTQFKALNLFNFFRKLKRHGYLYTGCSRGHTDTAVVGSGVSPEGLCCYLTTDLGSTGVTGGPGETPPLITSQQQINSPKPHTTHLQRD